MCIRRLLLVLLLCLIALPSLADVENQIDTEELLDILREISETAEEFARISKLGAAELRNRTDEEIFALYEKRPDIPVLAIALRARLKELSPQDFTMHKEVIFARAQVPSQVKGN